MTSSFSRAAFILAIASITASCHFRSVQENSVSEQPLASAEIRHTPEAIHVDGIHNAHWLGENILSGSQPEGPEAFEHLSQLGIKTLISVDGAVPDAEEAAKHGIRTVHLPIGYDGIPEKRELELIRAAKELPGPIYIHCHHGKHRGPSAAMIVAMGTEDWTPIEGYAALQQLGTSPKYEGLYACVQDFKLPTTEQIESANNEFPERTLVNDVARAMVDVSHRWENLKLAKAVSWKSIPDHPDVVPAQEALILRETMFELVRNNQDLPSDWVSESKVMEKAAADLEDAIRRNDVEAANIAFDAGNESCNACHHKYRN